MMQVLVASLIFACVQLTEATFCYDRSQPYFSSRYIYCEDRCCGDDSYQYCCTALDAGTIAGIVVGSLAGLGVLIGLCVCCCCCCCQQSQGARGTVVQPVGPAGVTVVNTTNTSANYPGPINSGYPQGVIPPPGQYPQGYGVQAPGQYPQGYGVQAPGPAYPPAYSSPGDVMGQKQ